jgi:hypothetical protein
MGDFDLEKLVADGWQRQHVDTEPRLSEAVEAYKDLGFEVLLVPVLEACVAEGSDGTCTSCFEADDDPGKYQVIYTRPKQDPAKSDADELF